MFPKDQYEKYSGWAGKSKSYIAFLFLGMALPLFPDDFFCYFSGLTKMKVDKFAAIIVLQETIKEFRRKGHFNFEAENVARFLDDSDMADRKDGNIYSSQLFPAEEGRAQVESILLTAEIVQYKRQLAMGKAYSWEYFLADMSQDQSLWNETLMAFRDALVNLDFKPLWQSEQLEELIKEMDPAE